MDKKCRYFQMKLLLSQFSEELRNHLATCSACWEAFMNIGMENEVHENLAVKSKKNLLQKAEQLLDKGAKQMEQFRLLSSFHFTPNARKVFDQYVAGLEEHKNNTRQEWTKVLARFEDELYYTLQREIKENQEEQKEVDAEIIMQALQKLGTPEIFVKTVETQQPAKIRRIYRSTDDRLLGGVCGGIGEYFRLDPVLIRILFVVLAFLTGGIAVLLYPVLWYILPKKPKSQVLLTEKEKSVAPENPPRLLNFIKRMVLKVFVLGLFAVVYVPLLLLIGGLAIYSGMGLFTPVISLDTFQISFADLGTPGLVGGASLFILLFSIWTLVLSFITRLHFKKDVLGKNFQAIFLALVVMSIFSTSVAFGIVINENKEEAIVSETKEFPVPAETVFRLDKEKLGNVAGSDILITRINVVGRKDLNQITVKAIVKAKGRDILLANRHTMGVNIEWSKNAQEYLPQFSKKGEFFHFEVAEVVLTIPSHLTTVIKELPFQTYIEGTFATIAVENHHSGLFVNNLQGQSIRIANHQGFVQARAIEGENVALTNTEGAMELQEIQGKRLELFNQNGSITAREISGNFHTQNESGYMRLQLAKSLQNAEQVVEHRSGTLHIDFPRNQIPTLKLDPGQGRIVNRISKRHQPDPGTNFVVRVNKGKVMLGTWRNYEKSRDEEESREIEHGSEDLREE